MKSEGQVRHQLQQVLYRHLQKRLRGNFKLRPHTCIYNKQATGASGFSVDVCHHQELAGVVCDVRVDPMRAKSCPYWEASQGKEATKAEFRDLIESGDRGRIASEYPDVAALLWVLDESPEELLAAALAIEEPAQ